MGPVLQGYYRGTVYEVKRSLDKHQRPAVSSDHLIRTLLSAWAAEMGIPVKGNMFQTLSN